LLCTCARQPAAAEVSVRVLVSALTSSADISRVSVTATPAGVSTDLTRDPSGTFSGTLSLPAGDQTVAARVFAGSALVGTGSAGITVVQEQTATVVITAFDVTGPEPTPDHSPVVTSLTASSTAVTLGDQVSLTATAIDADSDPIAFKWTAAPAGCGTFSSTASAATTWTAAALGTCAITVTATARGRSDSRGTSILVSPPSGPAAPALVQHVSSSANPVSISEFGNAFKFTLPNPVLPGNCLVMGISYEWSNTRTVSVTDVNVQTWGPPVVTADDGSQLISSIFVLPNACAGGACVETITITFDAPVRNFQYTVSELTGIATVAAVSGTSSAAGSIAPHLTSGVLTPADNDANGGNLIWAYFADGNVSGNFVTGFAPDDGFKLLDADIAWHTQGFPHASEYFVQTAAAPIAPGMTAAMTPANGSFNAVSVALKAATAGTAPASGIRIVSVVHLTNETPPLGDWTLQFPTTGNLIVLVAPEHDVIPIGSIADNHANAYVPRVSAVTDSDRPQFWTVSNATPANDLKMTLNLTDVALGATVVLYDIVGADPDPVDGVAGTSTKAVLPVGDHSDDIHDAPLITPASIGLTIASVDLGTGPITGLLATSPSGAIFDLVTYAGETDTSAMDNADGKAHVYNADLFQQSWNWGPVLNGQTVPVNYSSSALHFKAATIH